MRLTSRLRELARGRRPVPLPLTKPPEHLFAIISWGCAGTYWLARVLNSHPDIFATHRFPGTMKNASGLQLNGIESMAVIAHQARHYRLAGDVHGIDRQDVAALRKNYGERFACVVLVREPMARLRSQYALFREAAPARLWTGLDYLNPLLPRVGLTKHASYEERLIVHGANLLNALLQERQIAPIVRMEDVTSNPGALIELISILSRGALVPPASWAQAAVESPRTNVHASASPFEFRDWHYHVIRTVVLPEAWDAYEQLGYQRPNFVR